MNKHPIYEAFYWKQIIQKLQESLTKKIIQKFKRTFLKKMSIFRIC
jgi:hypothetical protein